MKFSPKYLTLFVMIFALFQSPGISASINAEKPCCERIAKPLVDESMPNSIENPSLQSRQIQILFNHSQAQIAAKERRILIPLLATGLLTLLAFVRV